MGQWESGKVEKVDARSAGEGALPFGQRVMFAVLRGRQPPLAAEGGGIAIGHACGVRVQRVQRVWYRRFAAMRFMLWRSCIGPPSQPKLALSLPIKGPSFCRLTVFGGSAAIGSENRKTGLRPLEMHPYPRLRRYFPRRGKF